MAGSPGAAFEGLPWRSRDEIQEAVDVGRAVRDPALARPAIELATEHHRNGRRSLRRLAAFGLILGVVGWLATGEMGWLIGTGVLTGFGCLQRWATLVRPARRAVLTNRAVLGEGPAPAAKERAHWFTAAMTGIGMAAVIGLIASAVVPRDPALVIGIAIGLGFAVLTKSWLDDRLH